MNIEELLRSELHHEAGTVAPIDGLLGSAVRRGRRKQLGHRAAVATSGIAAAAVVTVGAVAVAGAGHGKGQKVTPAGSDPSTTTTTPWWQTWTTDRHFGPVDRTFLDNARPSYGDGKGAYPITVWATGSEPDGTDWAMYTDPHDGNVIQYLQGWDGQPDYGESPQKEQPDLTWDSFMSPTKAAHDDYTMTSQYMIIVGRPGTTSIKYAPNGTDFTDLTVHDGIAVVPLDNFPPATAKVQLADANGVYATGTPDGAGAGASSSPTPGPGGGSSTPTPTPGDTTAEASPATSAPR